MSIDIERVKAAFGALVVSAREVNIARDELSVPMRQVEEVINALNLGVSAQVEFGGEKAKYYLGFGRVAKRWGLALSDGTETWAWFDAPNHLRVKSVEHVPALIEALHAETGRMTTEITDAVRRAAEMLKG